MVQLYVKHTDGEFYLLDIDESENINYKVIFRDLNDISKIFSPFTQPFSLKASDKNKILLGFIGNEKIQRPSDNGEFDAMIYISGFLFQSGKLKFDETIYEFRSQKTIKTTFASNLTGLAEKLGDSTIQEIFQDENLAFDPKLTIQWGVNLLKDRLASLRSDTLANGIPFKYGIPFISNNRVWIYDSNLAIVDNIAFKPTKTAQDTNRIDLGEVRPAISYMTIMRQLLKKFNLIVNCPVFDRAEARDLFAWCSSESLVIPDAVPFSLKNWTPVITNRYDEQSEITGVSLPASPKWNTTGGGASGIFMVKRNNAIQDNTNWGNGFEVKVMFNNLLSLEGTATSIKVVLRNADTGIVLDSQEISGNSYFFNVLDPVSGGSMLDSNGEIRLKVEVLPLNLVSWSNIQFRVYQSYRRTRNAGVLGTRVNRCKFQAISYNNTLSSTLGGSDLNLITSLPKMKCKDFLMSFFKTFNISVVSTGLQDQSMFWLTPYDIQDYNKPYSKRRIDYTPFTDIETITKKRANKYNQYAFSHKESKYYESVYGNGTRFGELKYPEVTPAKPTKFEVKTEYSILKTASTFMHPNGMRTCLGFEKGDPEVLPNGGNRYKPVFEEFTIFYLRNKTFGNAPIGVQFGETTNKALYSGLSAEFRAENGKVLSFGAEGIETNSLYLNYYKSFIELLLNPNTYQTEYTINLPANEIFMNFANLNQGESNIPTGFRPQNEIVIGELRNNIVEASINLTNGKGKITLLNL